MHSDTQTGFVCAHACMCHCVCVCLYRPQHTDGRLIKQLIKARDLGSEMRLLLFGKNCSIHHKKGGERRIGKVEKRKKAGEYQSHWPGMCQSLSYGAPPFLRPHPLCFSFCICMSVCVCVSQTLQWFCPCLTVIKNLRKLFKSKAVNALC